ncbi:hypothetical protein EDB84DRAFT_1677216, partial [Lactarius hengduanensis]
MAGYVHSHTTIHYPPSPSRVLALNLVDGGYSFIPLSFLLPSVPLHGFRNWHPPSRFGPDTVPDDPSSPVVADIRCPDPRTDQKHRSSHPRCFSRDYSLNLGWNNIQIQNIASPLLQFTSCTWHLSTAMLERLMKSMSTVTHKTCHLDTILLEARPEVPWEVQSHGLMHVMISKVKPATLSHTGTGNRGKISTYNVPIVFGHFPPGTTRDSGRWTRGLCVWRRKGQS